MAYFAEWRYDFSPPLYVDDRVMRTRFTPGAQFWFDLVTDTFIGGSKEIKDSTQVVNEKIATVRASERDVLTCVLESGRIVIIAKGQRLRHVRDGHLCDVFLQTEPKRMASVSWVVVRGLLSTVFLCFCYGIL